MVHYKLLLVNNQLKSLNKIVLEVLLSAIDLFVGSQTLGMYFITQHQSSILLYLLHKNVEYSLDQDNL